MVRSLFSLFVLLTVLLTSVAIPKADNLSINTPSDSGGPIIEDSGMIDGLAWTPDSRRVVMSLNRTGGGIGKGSDNLYQLDVATGRMIPLTRTQEEDTTPTISPDGRYVAFMRGPYSGNNIWVTSLSDKRARPITHFGSTQRGAADIYRAFTWSSDGKSIILVESSIDFSPRVSSISLSGARRRLPEIEKALASSKEPLSNVYGLASDRSGNRLAIFSVGGGKSRILIVDNKQSSIAITVDAYPGTVGMPRWSEDDRFVYVCADLDLSIPRDRRGTTTRGKAGTFQIDANTGRVQRVSEHYGELSPDGHKLLWEESARGTRNGFRLWLELLS